MFTRPETNFYWFKSSTLSCVAVFATIAEFSLELWRKYEFLAAGSPVGPLYDWSVWRQIQGNNSTADARLGEEPLPCVRLDASARWRSRSKGSHLRGVC